jgi:hypothetical protein
MYTVTPRVITIRVADADVFKHSLELQLQNGPMVRVPFPVIL